LFASTTMTRGNGQTAKFWEDRWIHGRAVREIAPDLYDCIPKRRRKTRTLVDGLAANHWAQDIRGTIEHAQLSNDDDTGLEAAQERQVHC
jgi:hypothetical protein